LMAARFGDHGAGPGNAAVSDLSVLDPETGEVSQILPDNVVEAAWGPDGRAVAYILATPSTYELHWRTAGGEDHLLAEDVTFTWSVAPSGEAIAFTRETGYELGVPPGLFVVTVPDGHEIQLSDADKGGVGSTGDRPAWSPDSQEVIFSLWGGEEDRLILARADGSQVFDIGLDPTASDAWWGGKPIPDLLWFPDREHLVVNSASTNAEHGPLWDGPTALVVYRIDRNQQRLADGRLVGEAMGLIGWNVPGESVWAFGPDGHPQSLNVLISR
jgi:Tol biopolymer transport system component